MTIAVAVAAVAIVVATVAVAVGRGGEMVRFSADAQVGQRGEDVRCAADVAALRPGRSVLGYDVRQTDDALWRISQAMADRELEVEALRAEVARLRRRLGQQAAADAVERGDAR